MILFLSSRRKKRGDEGTWDSIVVTREECLGVLILVRNVARLHWYHQQSQIRTAQLSLLMHERSEKIKHLRVTAALFPVNMGIPTFIFNFTLLWRNA